MLRSFTASRHLVRTLATHAPSAGAPATRHTWAKQEIQQIYDTPLLQLVFRAAGEHRVHHDPSKIQLCTLMNIKSAFVFPDLECAIGSLTRRGSWWMHRGL